ncbi:hypothetical protein AMECASPLE_018703 [Ameca splendens]|uniref:Immunoglobulin V-set domain-containing protein n=1 Tax=Ameca splendens TaxID=208324 RepID=A0ABV0ZBX8_9TELE
MYSSNSNVSLENGIHFNKYIMSSNTTNIFLKIKKVNFSDSGLYFCGTNIEVNLHMFTATYLRVEDGLPKLPSVILGCIAVFLAVVIIALTVKIRNFQTGQTEQKDLQPIENLDPDNLNYAALNFRPKVKRNIRPAAEGELGLNVVYASTK